MKEIFPDLDLWQSQGEDIALATVVQVRRSAPRPPGARLCITRSGHMSGSVSGGCVEADVFERAMQVLDTRKSEVANYGIADELGFEVGLSCGGSIDVLIEPFVVDAEWNSLRRSVEREQEAVYAIGLAPESVLGRKLVRLDASRSIGSIAPSLDSHISDEGEKLLQVGGTKIVFLPYEGEQAQVYMEAFSPVAQPPDCRGYPHCDVTVQDLPTEVGFQVTVVDIRTSLATPERFPDASRIIHAWPDEALAQVPLESYSSLVVLTHDPKFDVPALACGLRSQARYIGAQGSRSHP